MNQLLNGCLTTVNSIGAAFWDHAAGMFIQSGVLILSLLAIDFLLRKRVRATFRYWIWMLVFIKLILPPTLSLPTGIGYWFGDHLPAHSIALDGPSNTAPPESVAAPTLDHQTVSAEIPLAQPSEINLQPASPLSSPDQKLSLLFPYPFDVWLEPGRLSVAKEARFKRQNEPPLDSDIPTPDADDDNCTA